MEGNRVSKDSVLNMIADFEVEQTGYTLSAIIIKTLEIGDSTIHKIIWEKHRSDSTLLKIRKWEHLDLIGQKVNFESLQRVPHKNKLTPNKPTLLNFWFTACTPCLEEIPFLNSLHQEFKDDLNFVAVTFEPEELVRSFLKSRNYEFHHFVNGKGLADQLGVEAYPVTFLLDEKSMIIRVFGGFSKDDRTESPISWNAKELVKEIIKITAANNK
jgi:thiol-disulfide isomerase/thioredoxin